MRLWMYGEYTPRIMSAKICWKRWQYPGMNFVLIFLQLFSSNPAYGKYERHWSSNPKYKEMPPIASTSWDMYDYGNHRVVSGNYLKCSNLSLTYEFDEKS